MSYFNQYFSLEIYILKNGENERILQSLYCDRNDINICNIENRIYIRVEFRQSLGMNFVSPFQPEREFKVSKSCKCSQIISVEYINTVFSLDYPFQFRIFR